MMFSNTSTIQEYSNQPTYVETFNISYNTSNGTYQNNDEYYNFVYINKIYNDREYIYDLYSDDKYFGEEELKAEENIIKKNSIPIKDNFLDYYD